MKQPPRLKKCCNVFSNRFEQKEYDIQFDCSQLNYISSKGLRLFINLYKHLRDTGKHGFITKMNKNVKEVLYISGFLTLFEEIK